MKRSSKSQRSRLARRLHRITGALVAVFLLFVSATGIVLNHAEQFDLDSAYIPGIFAKSYFSRSVSITGYLQQDKHFYLLAEDLYVDTGYVRHCGRTLGGVETFADGYLVLCDGALLWLDHDLNIVDWLTPGAGVPEGLLGIGKVNDHIVVFDDRSRFLADVNQLIFPAVEGELQIGESTRVPEELLMYESISWQQFVLDLHSGHFFGGLGKLLSDVVAVLLILMAVTGLMLWSRDRKPRP